MWTSSNINYRHWRSLKQSLQLNVCKEINSIICHKNPFFLNKLLFHHTIENDGTSYRSLREHHVGALRS